MHAQQDWPRTGIFPVLFLCVVGLSGIAHAQFVVRSWLPWHTIETTHFAFHYPDGLEAWTRDLARHAESIDSVVAREVGYAPVARTDVVVDDPFGSPNGSAWPFLNRPIVNLWATPPNPRQDIGDFHDWGATLISHEFTHIAHLTRPSRNPFVRRLWEALPVNLGPIPLTAPRWVIEGYATYVEGRVTGSGRPHGAWRAAYLREWALEGQLPTYNQLNASSGYNGGEFAYLAGSAFLEWLVQQRGDSSLVHLWRRMSAQQVRSFDQAFTGVFGESAPALYGRFTADLTARAVRARQIADSALIRGDSGTIEQRLSWETGDPAFSPDGRHVVIVLRSSTARSRVVIWNSAAEPDTGKMRRDSILLARDPEDVPAIDIFPPPKRVLASLRSPGASYREPRFLRDGRVLLWRSTPRGDGSSSPDLYLWDPVAGDVRRVTHAAAVQEADPTPDGRGAIATHCHSGWCDLVAVNLITGSVRTLIPGAQTHSFYRPRVAPSGQTVVVSVHDGERWRLALVDLRTPTLDFVDPRDGANHYDATWGNGGQEIVDVSDWSGVPNLERIDVATLATHMATNVLGAAVAPAVNPANGAIWFLSLYSQGYDLRAVLTSRAANAVAPQTPQDIAAMRLPASLTPAVPLPAEERPPLGVNSVTAPHPFGLTPRLFRWIPQPGLDADGISAAIGLESMDIIGRSELLAVGAFGDPSAWRGASLSFRWNGTRPSIRGTMFTAAQRLTATRSPVPAPLGLDQRLTGGLISVDGTQTFDTWATRYGLTAASMSTAGSGARALVVGDAAAVWVQRGSRSSATEQLGGSFTGGHAFGRTFSRTLVNAGAALSGRLIPLAAAGTYGRTTADAPVFEQFTLGGGPSTVLDPSILTQRIAMPALPTGIATGSSMLAYRVSLETRPLSLYWWSGSTAAVGERFDSWHRVVGVEWSRSVDAIPLAGTPAASARIGAGESLDEPFRHRLRIYVSLILHP